MTMLFNIYLPLIFLVFVQQISIKFVDGKALKAKQFSTINSKTSCLFTKAYAEKFNYLRASGNILYAYAYDSIGNWFLTFRDLYEIALILDLALVVDTTKFISFDSILEPNLLNYKVSSEDINLISSHQISSDYVKIVEAHNHAVIVMSRHHWDSLPISYRSTLYKNSDTSSESCFHIYKTHEYLMKQDDKKLDHSSCLFNYMFRWTDYFDNIYQRELAKYPILSQVVYSVWHIRTSEGELHRWDPKVHSTYIINDAHVSNYTELCFHFLNTLTKTTNETSVSYIAGNSGRAKKTCKEVIPNIYYADLGLQPGEYHTNDKESPLPTITSFLDYRFLLNANYVIYSGSSFLASIIAIRDLKCTSHPSFPYSLQGNSIGLHMCKFEQSNFKGTDIQNNKLPQALSNLALDLETIDVLNPVVMSQGCGEMIWCNDSSILQKRIHDWQNPSKNFCDMKAKYLIYDPLNYGIGSMIHIATTALSLAICTGRILYFPNKPSPNNRAWAFPGCDTSSLECYFENITSCTLNPKQQEGIPELNSTNWERLSGERFVKIKDGDLPSGPCTFCARSEQFPLFDNIAEKDAFIGSEPPLMSQLVRYILRPKVWFKQAIQSFILKQGLQLLIKPFASMHVRYGDKSLEAPRIVLSKYMDLLKTHRPDLQTVFLSTETADVISSMVHMYPEYTFKYFTYSRIEMTGPGLRGPYDKINNEFTASFANLVVAIQADFFVGSLTSNWCRLIHELERTRGDGGVDYLSVDKGSQFSRCF